MIKTKAEFVKYFREEIMPSIKASEKEVGFPDYPMRAEAWNNLTDSLVTDRQLPKAALNWDNPFDRRK